jgi:alpha-galactosidase
MTRTLTLAGDGLAVALALPDRGLPEILAFGPGADEAQWLTERATRDSGMDFDAPAATLLPVHGMGAFGWPGLSGHRDGAASVLAFSDWRFAGGRSAGRLSGRDAVAQLELAFDLSICDGALALRTTLTNSGDGVFTLDRCMAGAMLLPEGPAELTSFTGMWGREFQIRREPLAARLWLQENRRGRTSHDRFPGVVLSAPGGGLAAHLGWSGNHVVAVETLDDGRRLVHLGELFGPGEIRLAPGEAYESPLAYFAPDAEGLRRRLGALMRWPDGRPTPRPVTLNTWEGTYFAHRLPALKEQATAAAALGIERFVLDDGWFGRRNSDATSLGDWAIDETKYPEGLAPLADHVHALGMQFGLWVEPEMVSPDSDLYRAHPDWVLGMDERDRLRSRKQLVLDLARPEVADHVFGAIDAVLRSTRIDCLKWDMNRDLAPGTDAPGRTRVSAQTRAAYALMDRILAAHTHLEIESCASGGARADYGALARTHRFWASDGTDALARLEIQRGARLFFPPQIIGAHVSASPNHQTHRASTLDFRALVAFAYHFGIELDPLRLGDGERERLTQWISLHKRLRPVLHGGRQFHLDPIDGRYVWGAADGSTLVVVVAQGPQMMGEQPPPLRLTAEVTGTGAWRVASCTPAAPDFIRISEGQRRLLDGTVPIPSGTLTASGLPLPMLRPQSGCVLEFTRIEGGQA